MPKTTKKTAEVKPAEKTVTTDAPAAVAAPAVKAEVKAAPKAAAKKPVAKKPAAKKAPAKKAAKKVVAKKAAEVIFQIEGKETTAEKIAKKFPNGGKIYVNVAEKKAYDEAGNGKSIF